MGIALIATAAAPTTVDGLFHGGGVDRLGTQLLGGGVVLAHAFVVSGIIGVRPAQRELGSTGSTATTGGLGT